MFFLLPVGVDYRAKRYPVVTFTLMGLCVAVYLVTLGLSLAYGEDVDVWVFENLWLIPVESHWWTYLTSVFCHGGFFHLLGNMVYLFLFGSCVEDFIGRVRFALFYLLAGVAAGFVYIAGTPAHFSSEIPMGGASGAISACIGGFVLLLAKTEIEFKWLFILFFRIWTGEFRLPAWVVISFWFGKDLLLAVLTALTSQEGGGVAFAAHVGGFLAGLGWVALEKPRLKRLAEAEEAAEIVERAAAVRARFATQRGNAPIRVRVAEKPTIHLHVAGEQYGPYTLPQIQEMFAAQQVAPDALYWQEGMEEWRPTEELRDPGSG